ncbi:MAG: ThiF family adenylyltransferase [Alphaproteobacteria bacterium]|nr:ThiF family adenylyltransferase [Alphaproteobacteria bacterium]
MNRYIRQLALPEMDSIKQETLAKSTIFVVGLGGLGSAALPYLAGAGVGHIILADNDRVDISNLHRQIVYRADQAGQSKATCTGNFLCALNPDIHIHALNERIDNKNALELLSARNIDLILDGSDNFSTKSLLNKISIDMGIPLITASVTQFNGQIGTFEGYNSDKPCYRCLFPELPDMPNDCEELGVLGTSSAIIGLMLAHIALCRLLNIEIAHNAQHPFARINLKTLEIEHYALEKDPNCPHCANITPDNKEKEEEKTIGWGLKQGQGLEPDLKQTAKHADEKEKEKEENKAKDLTPLLDEDDKKPVSPMPQICSISIHQIEDFDSFIIDVRQAEEIEFAPIDHPLITQRPHNIPLPELGSHIDDLPKDKRIAFICSKNTYSLYAAQYLMTKGFENVCILDRFSF